MKVSERFIVLAGCCGLRCLPRERSRLRLDEYVTDYRSDTKNKVYFTVLLTDHQALYQLVDRITIRDVCMDLKT